MFRGVLAWALLTTATASQAQQSSRPDIVVGDFEGSNYGDWKVEGTAFGKAPARGALPGQMAVEGLEDTQRVIHDGIIAEKWSEAPSRDKSARRTEPSDHRSGENCAGLLFAIRVF